jgi:hypothetical protein
MNFFIHNSLHSGDVLLTRVAIDAVIKKFPGANILLQCPTPMMYLWQDYGVKIFGCERYPLGYGSPTPTPECPKDFEFFNMWFGIFPDILNVYGLTHVNQVHTFNRQIHMHNTNTFLDLPTEPPVLQLRDLSTLCAPGTIYVENGPALSGQCNHGVGAYIHNLATTFPQYNFLCSANPQVKLPNVYDGSSYNLLIMSDLSNKCIAFITQASGANACTYTRHNLGKPRFFFGWCYHSKIWDDSAIPVNTYDQLVDLVRKHVCKK